MSSCNESLRKGQWSLEEDECLRASVTLLGERRWDAIARATGLKRSGKSCRLRWLNYLHPNLKHSPITAQEEEIILRLHQKWGNKWARIARRLPGRTDNEIKNYWRGCLRKKAGELVEQSQDSISELHRNNSMPLWNSDDDEADYNDVVKELRCQEDKSEESSPSSGGVSWSSAEEVVPDVILKPDSPYESHFLNWVLLLKSGNEVMGSHCNGGSQREFELGNNNNNNISTTTALDCWDRLWDMDNLFTSNSYQV